MNIGRRATRSTLPLVLAAVLIVSTSGPACLFVSSCPAATEIGMSSCHPAVPTALRGFSCCVGSGLKASLQRPPEVAPSMAPSCDLPLAQPTFHLAAAVVSRLVPPAPPPDDGLYTLHAAFLI